MKFSLDIPWCLLLGRIVLSAALMVILVVQTSAQTTDLPRLDLRRNDNGRLILSTKGDTGRAVLEQSDSLTPPINWGPARTTGGGAIEGAINDRAQLRVYRLRLVPVPPAPASSAHLGVLGFKEAPPRVHSGETVQFIVTGEAGTEVDTRWSVNGQLGGSASDGFISVLGRFTGPPTPTNHTVEILAEVTAANGDRTLAQTLVEVLSPLPPHEAALIPASTGGELLAADERARIEIPRGAMLKDAFIEIRPVRPDQLALLNADATQTHDVIARVEFLPDGTTFDPPATVRMKLDRYFEPGTRLPLEIQRVTPAGEEVWELAGIEGEVELDGVTLMFRTPHFSTLQAIAPRQLPTPVPLVPTVNEVIPARLAEGELRPILLRGLRFSRSLRVTAHVAGSAALAPNLQVIQTAYDPAAPVEFGVLLKSLPDSTLAAGASRAYTLRLTPTIAGIPSGAAGTVDIPVDGLDEFILGTGQTRVESTPTDVHVSRRVFSQISIREGAVLDIMSQIGILAWQATDRMEILGSVRAIGNEGESAVRHQAGAIAPAGPAGGSGGGISYLADGVSFEIYEATAGSPVLTPDLMQYLPFALRRIFGQPGANGHDPGPGRDRDPLRAHNEDMYALYADELRARLPSRDPFDFNFWRVLSEDLTRLHPVGRKGQQGVPGGRSGFQIGQRAIEPGGSGGGGGLSFRFNGFNLGLGGGQGGGGAVSLVAGGKLILGSGALIDTSGGRGGNGAHSAFGGGGGGSGGAGTIHLLAGERLSRPSGSGGLPYIHSPSFNGAGGFEMTVNSHRQADPRSWLEPEPESEARSQAELSGPDFSTADRGLRTGIQTGRAVEAVALNPLSQGSTVRVSNSRGVTAFRLRGLNVNNRTVRLLLAPGINQVALSGLADHAVLNRVVLVLNTPDRDGDGFSDAEEPALGYDPNLADSDGDGLSDTAEWLAGGQGVPFDVDGDGYPDAVEVAFGSNPSDNAGTPLNTNLGSGANRGLIRAAPLGLQVIRPAFGSAHGVPPSRVVATPSELRVVRPALGAANGVPYSRTVAQPQSVRVERR